METGFFGQRLDFVSLGCNGLNGRADFRNQDSIGDRWEKHGVEVKPWKHDGDYILICGQIQGDAAVQGLDLKSEYRIIAEYLADVTSRPLLFRPHPMSGGASTPKGIDVSTGLLADDLAGARTVVTLNSNSGVDAVLNGVQTITLNNGAMCREVSGHNLNAVEDNNKFDRTQWLDNLAYCQWTHDEIESGEAWDQLND